MSATIRAMPRVLAAIVPLATMAVLAATLLGCSTGDPVPTVIVGTPPPQTGVVVPPPTPTPVPVPASAAPAGQLDTDWGPIWERLPDGFPEPPRAEPAEADMPVSAAWTVPATALPGPREVAQLYADRFAEAGLGGGRDGPLEDGSYTTWASNGYGCDILVTAQRRGGEETFVTVLYGAGCPFSWLAGE